MPCYSSVQKTKLTDENRIKAALEALGYSIDTFNKNTVVGVKDGKSMSFTREPRDEAFSVYPRQDISAIGKKYAELGAREWARRVGFSITGFADDKMTLKNRSGK
jgi:hypothetical protein